MLKSFLLFYNQYTTKSNHCSIIHMKPSFIRRPLIILILMFIAGPAAIAQSLLKVLLTDNTPINVSVDGRYFNKRGTSVTVGDLPPGRHTLLIYVIQQDRRGRGHEEVIYRGKVNTMEGLVTIFSYDPNSRATNFETQDMNTFTIPREVPQPSPVNDQNNAGYPAQTENNSANNNDNNAEPASPVASPVSAENLGTLTDSKTTELKTLVDAKKTDVEKMKVLQNALASEKITTNQVALFMDWFSFESSKVDFAKWAYTYTVDKENFISLENKLTYKNYEDDLDKFIKSQH